MLRLTIVLLLAFIINGCVTKSITVTEYDSKGRVVRTTTTATSDVVDKIMTEMKDKDVAWYANGWGSVVELTLMNSDTYVPNIKFKIWKADTGHISLRSKRKATENMADVIKAMNPGLHVEADTTGASVHD